jgi:hypothetical protein
MAQLLTVISLLLPSTHCRYRMYTKFLLTYTAIYRGNRKVLPLRITALQPQSHFYLGTSYTYSSGNEGLCHMVFGTMCMRTRARAGAHTHTHTHTPIYILSHSRKLKFSVEDLFAVS